MIQPRPQFCGRNSKIGAQQVIAKELVERHSYGMLEIRNASHVSGRIPGIRALIGVLLQFTEVWRQKLILITHDGEIDSVGDKSRSVAEQVNVLMHLFHYLNRQLTHQRAIGDEEDGDLAISPSHRTNNLQRGALIELRVLRKVPIEQNGAERRVGLDEGQSVLGSRRAYDPTTLLMNGLAKPFHGTVGYRIRTSSLAGDQQNPASFAHPNLSLGTCLAIVWHIRLLQQKFYVSDAGGLRRKQIVEGAGTGYKRNPVVARTQD